MDVVMRCHTTPSEAALDAIEALERAIFAEPIPREFFAEELSHRRDLCILLAEAEGVPCGYKIGYADMGTAYFSFSGGVVPAHRRQGIATELMRRQHAFASERGYTVVRTRTKNKYRDMLILNIRMGFDVTGVNQRIGDRFHTILLEKSLSPRAG